jgi:hypothetical protein
MIFQTWGKTGFSDLQNVAINFFKFKLYRGTVPLTVENLNNLIW